MRSRPYLCPAPRMCCHASPFPHSVPCFPTATGDAQRPTATPEVAKTLKNRAQRIRTFPEGKFTPSPAPSFLDRITDELLVIASDVVAGVGGDGATARAPCPRGGKLRARLRKTWEMMRPARRVCWGVPKRPGRLPEAQTQAVLDHAFYGWIWHIQPSERPFRPL